MMPWEEYGGKAQQSTSEGGDEPWLEYATAPAPTPASKPQEVSAEQPQPVRTRSTEEEFKRQLGLFARHGITGLTGVGGAIADFGYGAANLAGADLKTKPSEGFQKLLSQLGLPEPETPMEQGIGVASRIVAGAMDPAAVATVGTMMPRTLVPKMPMPPAPPPADRARITPWDVAHIGSNALAGRYGAAARSLMHMGARELLHGHRYRLPHSLFEPMTSANMRLGAAAQTDDLGVFLRDPLLDPYAPSSGLEQR